MMYDGYSVEDNKTTRIKMDDIVACVDCKHYLRTFSMWLGQIDARCKRTHQPTVDLVSGKVSKVDYYQLHRCNRERTDEYSSNCGERGRYWSPCKETPENTMKLLKRTSNETN